MQVARFKCSLCHLSYTQKDSRDRHFNSKHLNRPIKQINTLIDEITHQGKSILMMDDILVTYAGHSGSKQAIQAGSGTGSESIADASHNHQ